MWLLGGYVDGKLLGIVHYIYHRSCWTIGDYCYLQDLFVAEGARKRRAGPRADRGGIRGRARGRREPRPLAHARDQRRCAQPLRHAGGPPRLHPVSQALLTISGSIEIRAKWREEWVVSVERRFTHDGILASYGSDCRRPVPARGGLR
jgi:hypothetical protein